MLLSWQSNQFTNVSKVNSPSLVVSTLACVTIYIVGPQTELPSMAVPATPGSCEGRGGYLGGLIALVGQKKSTPWRVGALVVALPQDFAGPRARKVSTSKECIVVLILHLKLAGFLSVKCWIRSRFTAARGRDS